MKIINTSELDLSQKGLGLGLDSTQINDFLYNGLDSCLTVEILSVLLPQLDKETSRIYTFARGMQAPPLEMMLRGIRVDSWKKSQLVTDFFRDLEKLDLILQQYSHAIWGLPLNPNSPKQLIAFFYSHMKIPPVVISDKGVRRVSTNREALEKVKNYFYAKPVVNVILAMRDISKKLSTLRHGVDSDDRMRTSYNIVGTETGRWTSKESAFGTGDNLQNQTDKLRIIYVPDPGMKFAYCDLKQAESRGVGYISGCAPFIVACESSDLHTFVAKMVWPALEWKGDDKLDKKIAGKIFYRDFSYRDMSKRGSHGCLTEAHEVLTPEGWVKIGNKPSKIMTYKNGRASWEGVTHWEDKKWDGELVQLVGRSLDIEATSDHRIVFVRDKLSGIIHEEPAIRFSSIGSIPLGKGYCGGKNEPLSRLVAAYQCDGHQKSTNRVEFHFHKERKFIRLEMLAKAADIVYERRGDKAFLYWNCPYKKAAGAYLLEWDEASLLAYCTEHHTWDGYVNETNSTTVCSVNYEHLEWLQTCGRLVGIGGNLQKPVISGFGSLVYRLQQNNRRFASKGSISKTTTMFRGRVLCPTVTGGAFFVRRNGKISITGNSNYRGTAYTMARHLKVETKVMEDFQRLYFSAFPDISRWHLNCARQLQLYGQLTTALGRRRFFFGRRDADETLREAIAYEPQSLIGDILNLGLYRVWASELCRSGKVQVIAQVHDAILVQYPEELENEIVPQILKLMEIEVPVNGRVMMIPTEASVGWNWQKFDADKNPLGIKEWTGNDTRKAPAAPTSILDRLVS